MQHAVILSIDAINDPRLSERAGVVGLTTSGWIKRGAIKNDGDCAIVAFAQIDYARIELEQTRIVVIKSFSCAHCKCDVIKCENERGSGGMDRMYRIDMIKEGKLLSVLSCHSC